MLRLTQAIYGILQKYCVGVYFSKTNVILKEEETFCACLSYPILKSDF